MASANTASITEIKKGYTLQVNDILLTTDISQGDDFARCFSGGKIGYFDGCKLPPADLPIVTSLSITNAIFANAVYTTNNSACYFYEDGYSIFCVYISDIANKIYSDPIQIYSGKYFHRDLYALYNGGVYYLIGDSSSGGISMWTSTNPSNGWSDRISINTNTNISGDTKGFYVLNGYFAIVRNNSYSAGGTVLLYTIDAPGSSTTWNVTTIPTNSSYAYFHLAYINGKYLLSGYNSYYGTNSLYTSDSLEASSWARVTDSAPAFEQILHHESNYYFINTHDNSSYIYKITSVDPYECEIVTEISRVNDCGLFYANGMFFIIAERYNASASAPYNEITVWRAPDISGPFYKCSTISANYIVVPSGVVQSGNICISYTNKTSSSSSIYADTGIITSNYVSLPYIEGLHEIHIFIKVKSASQN